MKILINGEAREIPVHVSTVTDLIAHLQLPPAAILVEHNGVALLRSQWATARVAADDHFELLRISAGG